MDKIGKYKIDKYKHLNNFLKNCQYHYIITQKYEIKVEIQICNNKIMITSCNIIKSYDQLYDGSNLIGIISYYNTF